MKAETSLYQLISNLTDSEKRHFKMHIKQFVQNESKGYLRLFETINLLEIKNKRYDETKIKHSLRDEPWIQNLTSAKKYLFDLILESNRSYKGYESISKQIHKHLIDADFLIQKEIYDKALEVLGRAEKLCELYQKDILMLSVYTRKSSLEVYTKANMKDEAVIRNYNSKTHLTLNRLNNLFTYTHDTYLLSLKQQRRPDHGVSKKINTRLFKIEKGDLSVKISPQSVSAKKMLYYNLHESYLTLDDHKNAFLSIKKALELYNEFPQFISEEIKSYAYSLMDHVLLSSQYGKNTEMQGSILLLKKTLSENADALTKSLITTLLKNITICEMQYLTIHGDFNEANKKIRAFEKRNAISSKLNLITDLNYQYLKFYCFFGTENYTLALKEIDGLLEKTNYKFAQDILIKTLLIKLVIFYEKGDHELFKYVWGGMEKQFKKNLKLDPLEQIAFSFFRQYANLKDSNKRSEKNLIKDHIELIQSKLKERKGNILLLQRFDLLSWLKFRINKTSYQHELIKRITEQPWSSLLRE